MNILVCIKQVPKTNEIHIDSQTKTLIRDGCASVVNPYDINALRTALFLEGIEDLSVTVITMGPTQGEDALRSCLALGAHHAYLISDSAFSGADTLATSYVLSLAIRHIQQIRGLSFDLIFCGKQSQDSDTAQVGPQLAEHLDIPQITNACELEIHGSRLHCKRKIEDGYYIQQTSLPCLLTIGKINELPLYPTMAKKIWALNAPIPVLCAEDLPNLDFNKIGLTGSPTKTTQLKQPERTKKGQFIPTDNLTEAARKTAAILKEANFF